MMSMIETKGVERRIEQRGGDLAPMMEAAE